MKFPEEFVWGAATSSYQIEGAAAEDGKGLSIWDATCHTSKIVNTGDTGDIACDHYHRWREDIELMKKIGIKAYRMSISWPRVLPSGTGKINQKGMDFYKTLIDALVENGITPYVTLFHWDFPYRLYLKGGMLNSDSPDWFAEYAEAIVKNLGGMVGNWLTINEPQCFVYCGYGTGGHSPGLKLPMNEVLTAAHNTLLAHGKAVSAIRAVSERPVNIGMATAAVSICPEEEKDIELARNETFSVKTDTLFNNAWWTDPIYRGSYPEEGVRAFGNGMPEIGADDMKIIHQPIDFIGLNIYQGSIVHESPDGKAEYRPRQSGRELTATNWNVTPQAMYWCPKFFYERYRKPIFITENGMAGMDWVSEDGMVHDPQRIEFMDRYLKENLRAIQDGIDIRGYFHWSLMDNFEWGEGYSKRFGLIHVDYATQKRRIKDSGLWYRDLIKSNGSTLI
jgi:beta-glucosidase